MIRDDKPVSVNITIGKYNIEKKKRDIISWTTYGRTLEQVEKIIRNALRRHRRFRKK